MRRRLSSLWPSGVVTREVWKVRLISLMVIREDLLGDLFSDFLEEFSLRGLIEPVWRIVNNGSNLVVVRLKIDPFSFLWLLLVKHTRLQKVFF